MNEAIAVTAARERKLRQLDATATQAHRQLLTLGETIRMRINEQQHAATQASKLEKQIDWLQREHGFAGTADRATIERELAKTEAHLREEQSREQFLADEIHEFRRQEKDVTDVWQQASSVVKAALDAFGPAGEHVRLRMQGKA